MPRRPFKAIKATEHKLQCAVVRWCRLNRPMIQERFAAIPNGARLGSGQQAIVRGVRLKREGLRPGMPDMVFWRDSGRVLWLELKNGKKGRLSDAQKELHPRMKEDGHTVEVATNLPEAMKAIEQFYKL